MKTIYTLATWKGAPMTFISNFSDMKECNLSIWKELYLYLLCIVKCWVRTSGVPSWHGQSDEVAEDIVQEAIYRTLKYAQSAELGLVPPIHALRRLSIVIAKNHYQDLRRREYRLVRLTQLERSSEVHVNKYDSSIYNQIDIAEVALDNVFRGRLFINLSHEIVKLPNKQRRALLIDLANRMHFGIEPTVLQQAFLNVGIQLQDYQQPLPDDPVERSQHASLLNIAYKRVANLPCVKQYLLAA